VGHGSDDASALGRREFLTTRWSVVRAAGGGDEGAARDALASLCASYWYPLYGYARRRGVASEARAT
jgi:RNA polymerase sigma-70 factor (ECF subfamily)